MSGEALDPRLHAFRSDLAAEGLRARVAAPRYTPGEERQVVHAATPLRDRPDARASWMGSGEAATEHVWFELREKTGASEFLGYDTESAEGVVTAMLKDGKPVLVTGSPGGRTIINTVLCVIVNAIDFEMPIQEAVAAPRLHHQWFPDEVKFEGAKQYPKLVGSLKEMGNAVAQHRQGDAHTIWIDPKTGVRVGVADKRLDGKALAE